MSPTGTLAASVRRLRSRPWLFVVLATLLSSGAITGAVPTAPGTGIDECTTIDTPGRYVLTEDLRAPAGTTVCLHVRASDVVLRGGGHGVVAEGGGTVGIGVGTPEGVSNVTVSNVTVRGWRVGLGFGNVDGGTVTGVDARDNDDGVRLAGTNRVRVSDTRATDNDGAGISLSHGSTENTVDGVVASDNAGGVELVSAPDNEVVDGRFDGNEMAGLSVRAASGTTFQGNEVDGGGEYGIDVAGSTGTRIVNTTVENTGSIGIRVQESRAVTVVDARVDRAGSHGVEVVSTRRSLLRDVRVTDSRRSGVSLGSARNTTLRSVSVVGNEVGLSLSASRSIGATAVTATENGVGVRLQGTHDSRFRDVRVREFGSTSPSDDPVGIHVDHSGRNTFADTTVRAEPGRVFSLGIHVEGGAGNRFSSVTVTDTRSALWFEDGRDHVVANATIERNGEPGSVWGTDGVAFVDTTVANNDAGIEFRETHGARIVSTGVVDNAIPSGAAGLELSGDDVRIVESVVSDNDGTGLVLARSQRSVIADTVATGNAGHGVRLAGTSDTRVRNVTATYNERDGIEVSVGRERFRDVPVSASNNTVTGSTVTSNFRDGIGVRSASNTTLHGITATDNHAGVRVEASPRTVVADSTIRGSSTDGLTVTSGSDGSAFVAVTTSRNARSGLVLRDGDDVEVTRVTAHRNFEDGVEIRRSTRVSVRSTRVLDNAQDGVDVDRGREIRVKNVTAERNRGGISLWGVEGWRVVDSVAVDNRHAGVGATADDGRATGNRVTGNDQGVLVSGENNTVSANVAERNDVGFTVSTDADTVLRNNTAAENAADGVRAGGVDDGTLLVADNTVRGNGAGQRNAPFDHSGVSVSGHVEVRANRIVDNDGAGVVARGADNTVRDNRIAGNTFAGVELVGTADATVAGNALRDNEYGVHLGFERASGRQGRSVTPTAGTTIEGNDVASNRRANVLIQGADDTLISGNRLVDGSVGVRVEPIAFLGPGRVVDATGTEIHDNAIADNRAFGVENTGGTVVNATGNFWGSPDGPSSPDDADAPFADPATGAVADGTGDAVSENRTVAGVSNVRFDPARGVGIVDENATVERRWRPTVGRVDRDRHVDRVGRASRVDGRESRRRPGPTR